MLQLAEPRTDVVHQPKLGPRPGGPETSTSRLLLATAVLAGLSLLALTVDLPLARWMNGHEWPGELRRLVRLSEAFAWGGTVGLIVWAAALLDPRGWRVAIRLAAGALGAGLAADVIKLCVARLRPSAVDWHAEPTSTFVAWLPAFGTSDLPHEYGHKLQSFPSAHAATAVGLAIGLALLYPRARWLFFAMAALAMLQRVEAQAHFASDVLAGAAIGCLIAAACEAYAPLRLTAARSSRSIHSVSEPDS